MTFALELVTELGGSAVLPDDGIVDRATGSAIPYNGRFPLVADPDGRHVLRRHLGAPQHVHCHRDLGVPDLFGVVLNPPTRQKDLPELLLGDSPEPAAVVEEDRPRTCRPLIEGQDI